VPLRAMLDAASGPRRERPTVAISFDDGYADNYEYALPLLAEYDLHATIFITAGLCDGDAKVRRRFEALRSVAADEIRPLAWTQVREMRAAGLEIGAHTYSHPNLIRLDRDAAMHELRLSKDVLEERIGTPVDLMAYPFGKPGRQFNETTVGVAREVGYSYAAAVLFRGAKPSDSPLALPRFFVAGDSLSELGAKIRGDWDYLGAWQEYAPRALARLVSPQDFRF
jgi:peptidoglycan/xylan/chitin deacetylase (PgdA/CDA1 family)